MSLAPFLISARARIHEGPHAQRYVQLSRLCRASGSHRLEKLAADRATLFYQIRHSFAAGLRRIGTDAADILDLYGHTRPATTMIYALPELTTHRATHERLRQTDSNTAPPPAANTTLDGQNHRDDDILRQHVLTRNGNAHPAREPMTTCDDLPQRRS